MRLSWMMLSATYSSMKSTMKALSPSAVDALCPHAVICVDKPWRSASEIFFNVPSIMASLSTRLSCPVLYACVCVCARVRACVFVGQRCETHATYWSSVGE